MSLGGFAVAFVLGWKFAFVSLGCFPGIFIATIVMTKVM